MSSAANSTAERLCDCLIEVGWLATLLLLPLAFNPYSDTRYEPEKVVLLRSLAALVAGAWTVKAASQGLARSRGPAGNGAPSPPEGNDTGEIGGSRGSVAPAALQGCGAARAGGRRKRRSVLGGLPFVAAAASLLLAHLIGTAVSVAPHASLWGSYLRRQGAVTLACYVVLFLAVAFHLRRIEQWHRIAFAILLTSIPVSAVAIAEQFGIDPFGLGEPGSRSIATLGNPIFLGAYLIFPVFVSLERILSPSLGRGGRLVHGGILLLQLVAMTVAQSRGPSAGLAAGAFFLALIGLILWRRGSAGELVRRWAWLSLPVIAALLVALLVAVTVPGTPLAAIEEVPYLGRISRMFDIGSSTARVRLLAWRGVADLFASPGDRLPPPEVDRLAGLRIPFGYGPETLTAVFGRFYPPELGPIHGWEAIPDRAHNETFDLLAGTGALGLASFLVLLVVVMGRSARWLLGDAGRSAEPRIFLTAGLLIGFAVPVAATGSIQLTAVGLPLGLLGGLFAWTVREGFRDPQHRRVVPHATIVLVLFAAVVAHFVDIEVGIAVTPTRAHFWVLLGVLAAIFGGRLAGADGGRSAEAGGGSSGQTIPEREAAIRGLLCALSLMTLTFGFFTFAAGSDETVPDLLSALVRGRAERPPGAGWLLALTVTGAAALLLASTDDDRVRGHAAARPRRWPTRRCWTAFALPAVAAPAAFVLVHALRLAHATRLSEDRNVEPLVHYMASYFSAYHLVAIALVVAGGVMLASSDGGAGKEGRGSLLASFACVAPVIAIVWLAAVPGLRSVRADIYFHQAKALAAAERWTDATRIYDLAIARRPREDSYHFWRGSAYFEWARTTASAPARQERFDRALESLRRALELNPLDVSHHANIGRVLTVRGAVIADPVRRRTTWLEARASYDRALQLHPRSPDLAAERDRLEELMAAEG